MNRAIGIVLCVIAVLMQAVATGLLDIAEALNQMGRIAIDKARHINNKQ